jgi:hypothetical protein
MDRRVRPSITTEKDRNWPIASFLGMLLILLLTPGGREPRAAIFNVTTPAEFQTALTTAEGNGQDDTINVAAGAYDVSGGGLTYSGAAEGFSLTIEGAGAATTTLDGGNAVQILSITASTSAGTVTVRGMTFQNGTFSIAPPGTLRVVAANITLESSRFLNNTPGGGGANLTAFGNVTVTGCEFRGNSGDIGAGGLNINNRGTTVVSKNLIAQNTGGTTGAGGAWIRDTGFTGGSVTLVNNIIADNHFSAAILSLLNGGGLAVTTSGISGATTVRLTNNTIASNSSNLTGSNGGTAVAVSSATTTIDLYNNILFGNLSGSPGPTPASSDLSAGFTGAPLNLFNNIVGTFSVTGNVSQGNNLSSDPLLTADWHLQAGSPAIDNGANAAPSVPADDIDGDVRPLDGDGDTVAVVDIGADEAPGVVIPVPDIAVAPASVTFPDVIQGQSSPPEEVTLSNTGAADLTVTGIAIVTGTHYAVAAGGSNACASLTPTIPAGGNCTVQVTFSPLAVANGIADTLRITSDDPDEGTVDVPLSGNGVAGPTPDIAVAPASVTYTDVVFGNSSAPQAVTLSNTGAADLSVTNISLNDVTNFSLDLNGGPNGCGSATPTIASGTNCTVSVTFSPLSVASFSANLTIVSNDPDEGTVDVPLSGNGTPTPASNISVPASVNIGGVVVNEVSAPSEVAILNIGNLDLNVSSISLDAGTEFSLDPSGGSNPCGGTTPTIAMGDNCTVAVSFAPMSLGAFADNLTILSDDPDEGTVKVPLLGTGIDNVSFLGGNGSGCSCRIAGDGWSFADGAPTAAVLLLPFLWLALAKRRFRRRLPSTRPPEEQEGGTG